ncbi:hypothetical protein C2U70_28195 [Bradyrhizobium guangdongense]|uniref:hypothetical protein n=1 Tax=Bradyrhizobium guangdongense TaxID=1325090 RepID=UPI00112C18B3|nr:hypothetical protein [Bradyrhizobium guangdongense]TPQ29738.1 hypothetical protein C2U70_28195 [Bradyrhizobium guangdongense]
MAEAVPGRKRTIWLALGGFLLAGSFLLLLVANLGGPGGSHVETDRYRVTTEIVLSDHGRELRNTVAGECVGYHGGNWNTGVHDSIVRQGDNPFLVLSDRSLLMFADINKCLPSPVNAGDVYTFDPDVTSAVLGRQIRMPFAHAWRFDDVDDPTSIRIYAQAELFRSGVDDLKVVSARLSFAGRNVGEPLPFAGEDAFPWLGRIPWADVGKPDYATHLHRSTFSGFEVQLHQLGEAQRCAKFDRDAEGPILVEGDVWDACPPWSGPGLGWLVATPGSGFSRIDYAYGQRSTLHVATLYRATWLSEKGAPGVKDEDSIFYWRPELCFDGLCVRGQAARRPTWDGFRLYYPRKNQVITVRWQSPAVSTIFRRRAKSS